MSNPIVQHRPHDGNVAAHDPYGQYRELLEEALHLQRLIFVAELSRHLGLELQGDLSREGLAGHARRLLDRAAEAGEACRLTSPAISSNWRADLVKQTVRGAGEALSGMLDLYPALLRYRFAGIAAGRTCRCCSVPAVVRVFGRARRDALIDFQVMSANFAAATLPETSGKAPSRAERLISEGGAEVAAIHGAMTSFEEKTRKLCERDRSLLDWNSKDWADLYGISRQAVEKWKFWRVDRPRMIAMNRR